MHTTRTSRLIGGLLALVGLALLAALPYGQRTTEPDAVLAQSSVEGHLSLASTLVQSGDTLAFFAQVTSVPSSSGAESLSQNQGSCPSNLWVKFNNKAYCLYDDGITNGDFRAGDGLYTTEAPVTGASGDQIIAGLYYGETLLDSKLMEVRTQGDVELIILTDWQALYEEFLDNDGFNTENGWGNCTSQPSDFNDLVRRMEAYATAYSGTIVDVRMNITQERGFGTSPGTRDSGCSGTYTDHDYATGGIQDRQCMALLIDELVEKYTGDKTTRNIVLLGNDEVIPFYRIPDPTDKYGEVSGNPAFKSAEREYMLPGAGTKQDNPVLADMNEGYIMSDVPYSIRRLQNITLDFNWLTASDYQKKPQPDMGIGRIYDLSPCALMQALERYQKPLELDQVQAQAAVFVGTDMLVKGGGTLDMRAIVDHSIMKHFARWFGERKLDIYDAEVEDGWKVDTFTGAFYDHQLVTIVGHSNHMSYRIQEDSQMLASRLVNIDLDNQKRGMLVALGGHMGLSLSDHTNDHDEDVHPVDDRYKNSFVNYVMGYGHGIPFFAPTSCAYVFGKELVPSPAFHERMMSLFADHALDYTVLTMGDLWKRTYQFYIAAYPDTKSTPTTTALATLTQLDNGTGEGADLFHIAAAYGVALYGLPTQQIRSLDNDFCGGRSPYHTELTDKTQQHPTQVYDNPSTTFDVEQEEIRIAGLPQEATGTAELAYVVHDMSGSPLTSHRVLVNLDDFADTHVLTHAVDTTGWLPLEDITLDVYLRICSPSANGGNVTNLVPPITIPIEKGELNSLQLVDKYPDKSHKYLLSHTAATWHVGVYDKNGIITDEVDFSDKFNLYVDGVLVSIDTPKQDANGIYTVVLPLANVQRGTRVVRIELAPTFVNGKERTANLHWNIDYTSGIEIVKVGKVVKDETKTQPTATFTVTVLDEQGEPVPYLVNPDTTNPNVGIHANINGKQKDASGEDLYDIEETPPGSGVYKVEGKYVEGETPWMYIEAMDTRGKRDRLAVNLNANVEERINLEPIEVSTDTDPMVITLKVTDPSGNPIIGLRQTTNGDGFRVRIGEENTTDYTVTDNGDGTYAIGIPRPQTSTQDATPAQTVVVTIEVHWGDIVATYPFSLNLTSKYSILLPLVLRVATMPDLPTCNSFTFGDIPDNQQPLQWVNSCCKGEPTQDDYYLVELQPGQTITASLSFIPKNADYDVALYDRELQDYKAFSTNRENSNELLVYTAKPTDAGSSYYLRVILDEPLSKGNQYQLCVDVGDMQKS